MPKLGVKPNSCFSLDPKGYISELRVNQKLASPIFLEVKKRSVFEVGLGWSYCCLWESRTLMGKRDNKNRDMPNWE